MLVIGLDAGYGNVKVATGERTEVVPSLVSLTRKIGLAASGIRLQRATIVNFRGHEYAIGPGAPLRGIAFESIDETRFIATPTLALLLGAVARVVGPDAGPIALVVGLPVSMLQADEARKGVVRSLRQELMGTHTLQVNGETIVLDIRKVWTRAQPLGVWAQWAVMATGALHPGARNSLVGIVDIGFHTVDLFGVQAGQAHLGMVAGAELGVRTLLEDAKGNDDVPYHTLLWEFSQGILTVSNDALASWVARLTSFIRRRWRDIRPHMVILAGGGVAMLQERGLVDALRRAVRAETYIPPDPITAGAQGLWKLGHAMLTHERQREQQEVYPETQA
jgi:hypothetical protein